MYYPPPWWQMPPQNNNPNQPIFLQMPSMQRDKKGRYKRKDAIDDIIEMSEKLKKMGEFFEKDKKKDEKKDDKKKELDFGALCTEIGKLTLFGPPLAFAYYEIFLHFFPH